ncbi:serine aminopeptidase domain-containing protein [Aquimarina sp. 2201CG5-10]|uniref:alpha/beta hydrolase family protein n=1 Tax=Aquimarina callyspongiae TaxID=3098150 RepID=UPI002AB3D267|nr:alpha/beta hydrolase [Aquimarina sp. 2201CG5-10]MDY8135665.1 alpha/beta hydrolase [Aquimarina sp. 2201CG5-10]
MQAHTIQSSDGFPISIHEFIPSSPIGKTIVFAPAVAVPQKFYFNLASYLAEKGCNVFTFDYRGIGSSLSQKIQSLKDHGFFAWSQDFKAVSKYANSVFPENKQYMIGHSYGGNSVGFSDAFQYYDKYLTIGSQFGFYKHFSTRIKILIYLNFKFFVPITTSILGYYPSSWFGLGRPLTTKAAKDWAIFLLHPDSMLYFTKGKKTTHYQDIKKSMLLVSIDDDSFAPKKSVDILGERVYKNADVTRKHLKPADYNLKTIGHFDFFRKKNQDILWPLVNDWFQL